MLAQRTFAYINIKVLNFDFPIHLLISNYLKGVSFLFGCFAFLPNFQHGCRHIGADSQRRANWALSESFFRVDPATSIVNPNITIIPPSASPIRHLRLFSTNRLRIIDPLTEYGDSQALTMATILEKMITKALSLLRDAGPQGGSTTSFQASFDHLCGSYSLLRLSWPRAVRLYPQPAMQVRASGPVAVGALPLCIFL
jgi:hypothetical protein